ncbi:helix-turn-helix domain-containing protein [Arthrobacter sp. H14]|uniref:helix-turn-helix domain-containing protein n=1 Tax=Arthrobacter sp. H14 TaxID=1312959 RepID=UPI0004787380|nr:helix-turn-helix domain-containing protein [Arthrobacter sp. H14]
MTGPRNPAEEPGAPDQAPPTGGRPGPRFLSVKDVAAELAIGEPSVRGLISTGELAAIQIGGRGYLKFEHVRKSLLSS